MGRHQPTPTGWHFCGCSEGNGHGIRLVEWPQHGCSMVQALDMPCSCIVLLWPGA
jgi:hypothetical protein